MSEVLDGFFFGIIIGALVLSIALNFFLYFGIPSLVMGIIEEYFPAAKRGPRGTPFKLGGIMDNPIVSTMVGALRANPESAPSAPETHPTGLLGRMLRR